MDSSSLTRYLQKEYIPKFNNVSAFLALLIILFMIGMSIYDRKLVDRVSLRLQTGIAFYDVWLHTGSLWRTPLSTADSPICTFIGWQRAALPVFYAFFNVAIGVNLQLIFLHNKTITKKIEAAYWLVPIILVLIITIPPLALGQFGFSDYNLCYLVGTSEGSLFETMFDLFANQIWKLSAMIYLSVVVILVMIKLNRGITFINTQELDMNSSANAKAVKAVKLLAYRVLLYPLSMIISHSGTVISQFYYDVNATENVPLDQWAWVVYPWAGLLNFIAFCCDPTVHNAVRVVYYRIKSKLGYEVNKEELSNEFKLNDINTSLENGSNADDSKANNFNDQVLSLVKSL